MDVWKADKGLCQHLGSCPAWFFSLPRAAWDGSSFRLVVGLHVRMRITVRAEKLSAFLTQLGIKPAENKLLWFLFCKRGCRAAAVMGITALHGSIAFLGPAWPLVPWDRWALGRKGCLRFPCPG